MSKRYKQLTVLILLAIFVSSIYFSGFLGSITQTTNPTTATIEQYTGTSRTVTILDKVFTIEKLYSIGSKDIVYCAEPSTPPRDTTLMVDYFARGREFSRLASCSDWYTIDTSSTSNACKITTFGCMNPTFRGKAIRGTYYRKMSGDQKTTVDFGHAHTVKYNNIVYPIPYKTGILIDPEHALILRAVYYDFETDKLYYGNEGLRSYIKIYHNQRSPTRGTDYTSFYYVLTGDSFDVSISDFEKSVFETDVVDVTISINNKEPLTMYGKLDVVYNLKTFFGIFNITDSMPITINSGMNTYSFTIPTEELTENLVVTPSITIDSPVGQFQGNFLSEPTTKPIKTIKFDSYQMQIQDIELLEIYRLEGVIADKAELIRALSEDVAEQGEVLKSLEESAENNAQLILTLQDKISDQALLLSSMENTIQENIDIIVSMDLTIADQTQMINELSDNIEERDMYIIELVENIEEQDKKLTLLKQTVADLDVDYAEAKDLILQLNDVIDNADTRIAFLSDTVEELQLDNQELADLLESTDNTVEEDAELLRQLRLSNQDLMLQVETYRGNLESSANLARELQLENEQLLLLIGVYEGNLDDMARYITELRLSVEREQLLIDQLNLSIEEQDRLLKQIKYQKMYNYVSVAAIGMLLLISIALVLKLIRKS